MAPARRAELLEGELVGGLLLVLRAGVVLPLAAVAHERDQVAHLTSSRSPRPDSNRRPRAWKARALPPELLPRFMFVVVRRIASGEGRIRTSVGYRRQIYSLLPLATRVPLRTSSDLAGWSRWSESNRRPADYKSAALPLSYIGGPHHPPCARRRSKLSRATSLAALRAVRDPDGSGGGHTPSVGDRKLRFIPLTQMAVKEGRSTNPVMNSSGGSSARRELSPL